MKDTRKEYVLIFARLCTKTPARTGNPLLATIENISVEDEDEHMMLVKRAAFLRLLSVSSDVSIIADTDNAVFMFDRNDWKVSDTRGEYSPLTNSVQFSSMLEFITSGINANYKINATLSDFAEAKAKIGGDTITEFEHRDLQFSEVIDSDVTGFIYPFKNNTHRSLAIYKEFNLHVSHVYPRFSKKHPAGYEVSAECALAFMIDYRRMMNDDITNRFYCEKLKVYAILYGIFDDCSDLFEFEGPRSLWNSEEEKAESILSIKKDYLEFMGFVSEEPIILYDFFNRLKTVMDNYEKFGRSVVPENVKANMDLIVRFFRTVFNDSMSIQEIITKAENQIPRSHIN
jgi:hypothetical protein